jgi:hypothetical protein
MPPPLNQQTFLLIEIMYHYCSKGCATLTSPDKMFISKEDAAGNNPNHNAKLSGYGILTVSPSKKNSIDFTFQM